MRVFEKKTIFSTFILLNAYLTLIVNYAKIYETNHMRLPLVAMANDKASVLHELYDKLISS